MKTLLEWLEENRSTLKDGVYEVTGLGNICRDDKLTNNIKCKYTSDKYQVVDGVITLLTQPLQSLYSWLASNDTADGVFETDGKGLLWVNGNLYEPETYVQPTTDKYKVLKGIVRKLGEHEQTSDPVNSPLHYASGDIECIDAIKASMTREAFLGYLKGNIQKYMWRYEKKVNPIGDVKKARWYMNKLVDELDK